MQCQNCNADIPDDAKKCPYCGKEVKPSILSQLGSKIEQSIPQDGVAAPLTQLGKVGIISTMIPLVFITGVFGFFVAMFLKASLILYALLLIVMLAAIYAGFLYRYWSLNRTQSAIKNEWKDNYVAMEQRKYKSSVWKSPEGINIMKEGPFALEAGETVILHSSPVYRLQAYYSGLSGVSVERYTENTIVVTGRRVVFLTVPLSGQGLVLQGSSVDFWNDVLKRKEIEDRSREVMEKLSQGTGIDHYPNDFWISRDQIKEVKYLKVVGPMKLGYAGAIKFVLHQGSKLKYNIVQASDVDPLANEFNATRAHVL
ncbi:zinc-ribbon domain-containing protein [Thermoplasmatales archaeon AK]|nr:zinc-ribbon domain-containing protein [Thermoplasmatales archaeon AK]